ncbi:MAG: hypothetical protein ACNS62_09725 [Candidatus Cyclobacteriaceae bacterium M3_2C_046]
MAKPTPELIQALRNAAIKIRKGAPYQWGHMGSCNCGHLAQEITHLTQSDIHKYALRRYGDWSEQTDEYCPTSGYPLDHIISEMLKIGLDRDDLKHLERLSDPEILRQLPADKRHLKYNYKADVVTYMEIWADLLEAKLFLQKNLHLLNEKKVY